jgi:uncharacterized protein (TIGR02598 family)
MKRTIAGFSLVEVTIAIGIIGFAFIAIVGLLPVGTRSGADAIDATRTALIAKDVQVRARSSVGYTMFSSTNDVALPTFFYDREGNYVGNTVTGSSVYRADTTIHGNWSSNVPANVDATVLRPVTVQLLWPVDVSSGNHLGSNAASFTFYVRRP